MELLGGLAVVALIWYGSTQIASNTLTQGEFLSFVAAAFLMYGPVKKLSRVNATIQQAMAAAERIFELLDTHSRSRSVRGPGRSSISSSASSSATSPSPTTMGTGRAVLRGVSFTSRSGR